MLPLPRNRAYTLVEMLVAAAVATGVLAMAISLFTATRRMSNAGDLSAAMSEATIAMEHLHRDLIQAVQKPDQKVEDIVFVSPKTKRFAFIRGDTDPSGKLIGELVTYERQETPGGHFRLLRQAGGKSNLLPGIYSAVDLSVLDETGGPFVRVTLHVVARDATTGTSGTDETVVTTLMRTAGPEMLRSGMLQFKFMKGLSAVELPADF